jgi:hypothetical protein
MYVIDPVANATLLGKPDLVFYRRRVARNAIEPRVFSVEHEARLHIVIKLPDLPPIGVMAFIAIGAQTTSMRALIRMAIAALAGCFLKLLRQMTRFAGNDRVQADKWKFRYIVIKLDTRCP